MNTVVGGAMPGRIANLLATLSVACFWLLPLSPMIAIGAVWTTRGVSGRSRNLAVTGAALCIAYTAVMGLLIVRLALQVGL
jgi:hypothetical protein